MGGGLTFMAVGLYGEIQGPITVIIIMEATNNNPIIVIHPAAPLLANEVNAGMRRARIVGFVSSLGNPVPPRIVSLGQGMRKEYPR